MINRPAAAFSFLALLLAAGPAIAEPQLHWTGHLDDRTHTTLRAVSGDGRVAVGVVQGGEAGGIRAVYWTEATGLVDIDPSGLDVQTLAYDASYDGSVVVGAWSSNGARNAAAWVLAGNRTLFDDLPGQTVNGTAQGVTGDGRTIVGTGLGSHMDGRTKARAMVWTESWLYDVLNGADPMRDSTGALGVSADGAVVVGASKGRAAMWAPEFVALGEFEGGYDSGAAFDVSADGTVVVGESSSTFGTSAEAFRWTSATGMVSLGDLPGGQFYSEAKAITADGRMIIGTSSSHRGNDPFVWTAWGGLQSVRTLLETRFGFDTAGLDNGVDVSDDGLTIVGTGYRPGGGWEGWILTVIDDDGDGVSELVDNCNGNPNPDQADLDGDGLGDVCDPIPARADHALAQCEALTADADGDGVYDASDACPDTIAVAVDASGCSQAQFCGSIEVTGGRSWRRCKFADWRNDASSRSPRDCRPDRIGSKVWVCEVR